MDNYRKIETLIKKVEIGKAIRERQTNYELVNAYWNIGKLIVEAQGGKEKSKYGDALLKEWSEKLSKEYGKCYKYSNMRRFRQFYLTFSNCAPLERNLTWTLIKTILPIKDESKRNYYNNLCLTNNLSRRELEKEIKNNSYERLEHKPDKVDIITSRSVPAITENFKNPIILNLNGNKVENEKDLEKLIYSQLSYVFMQLGNDYMGRKSIQNKR